MSDCYLFVQVEGKCTVGVLGVREKRAAEDREAVFKWIEKHRRKPSEHQSGEEMPIGRRWRRMRSSLKSLPDDVQERIDGILSWLEGEPAISKSFGEVADWIRKERRLPVEHGAGQENAYAKRWHRWRQDQKSLQAS